MARAERRWAFGLEDAIVFMLMRYVRLEKGKVRHLPYRNSDGRLLAFVVAVNLGQGVVEDVQAFLELGFGDG